MSRLLLTLLLIIPLLLPTPAFARQPGTLGVQAFLEHQPGPLKALREDNRSAAAIIEASSVYYGLSPRLHLALLEATRSLLSDPAPAADALQQPFGSAGPVGFAAQIEWASRELRAGFGPYQRPPTLYFTDGLTAALTLDQAPEGVAVQRFLAAGRTKAEWRALVERFGQVFQHYFNNQLLDTVGEAQDAPLPPATDFVLRQPWPMGERVVHLAYFDHAYPTVDSGDDGNDFVVTNTGDSNVQYDGHDGHDYLFPAAPIGTPILAAAAGMAYARTHRGNGVLIRHEGGYETVYWHLDSFAPIFADLVDSGKGVAVEAGDLLGTSGRSGFVLGNPHLHFEVRRQGKQVDPYGWYGPGIDPCVLYAGCSESSWLWDEALAGSYDFTRPGSNPVLPPPTASDESPPRAAFAVNPPRDLLLYVGFDGQPVQTVGKGLVELRGTPSYGAGRFGEALRPPPNGALTYPITGNLSLAAGTISLWAELPATYPATSIQRHYLFAASANPGDEGRIYTDTLALRRDLLGPNEAAQWSFWTTGARTRDLLAVPDTLAPGWHHFAVSWDQATGMKALAIDGVEVARTTGADLPAALGDVLQLGRFTYGGGSAGVALDELAIYHRVLDAAAIAALAQGPVAASAATVNSPNLRLDVNAIDDQGGIVAVQLGRDGTFEDPQPYYDNFRWRLPAEEGPIDLAVRFFDRASNSTILTRTISLELPPRGVLTLKQNDELGALVLITARDAQEPIEMQVSQRADFVGASWQPLRERLYWSWEPLLPQQLYARFRDSAGNVSEAISVAPETSQVYLPLITK